MSQQELLALVCRALEKIKANWFVTGSWSSSLQGEPRSTHDLDLVVQLSEKDVDGLLTSFEDERFYLSRAAMEEAIRQRSMFNLLDTESGNKVDFWLLTDESWDQLRFARRITEQVFGLEIYLSSPEDTILAKLRWARLSGGSEKHMRDAQGVFEVQSGTLDLAYIDEWARHLDVSDLWQQLQAMR